MQYKKGQVLYSYYADGEDGTLTPFVYVVRTIRGGNVYAILKASYTWGKLSAKSGHYGWLDPLPPLTRDRTRQGNKFYGLFTTKRQALLDVKKHISKNKKWYDEKHVKKWLTNIKRQLTQIKKGAVCRR